MKTPLYRVLHSKRILSAVVSKHEVGWLDGGCLILAQALKSWLTAELVLIRSEGRTSFDHAAVPIKNPSDRKDWLFIDADGMSDEYELLTRWTQIERLVNPTIYRHARCQNQDRILSRWLVKELRAQFGQPKENIVLVLGRASLQANEWLRFYPRTAAHVIAHSNGFCSAQAAARMIADAGAGRQSSNDWCQVCYGGDSLAAVAHSVINRHCHRDGMSSVARAKRIVDAAVQAGIS